MSDEYQIFTDGDRFAIKNLTRDSYVLVDYKEFRTFRSYEAAVRWIRRYKGQHVAIREREWRPA